MTSVAPGLKKMWAVAAVFALVAVAGCDDDKQHPARDSAEAFLDALKYRDATRVFQQHVESTDEGVYCRSDAFKKVLDRTREQKTEADCRDARKLGPGERAALKDDAELLVQILRFVCDNPEGECRDYARRVFVNQLRRSSLWERSVSDYSIQKIMGDSAKAVVYVDLTVDADDPDERVRHQTYTFENRDGEWLVTTPVTDEESGSDPAVLPSAPETIIKEVPTGDADQEQEAPEER